MCYIRGNARDYDDWAELGADGWDWDDVLPYFKRSEGNERGGSEFHGGDGPLGVSDLRHRNPLSRSVPRGRARRPAIAANDDFNGAAPGRLRLVPGHHRATAPAAPAPQAYLQAGAQARPTSP